MSSPISLSNFNGIDFNLILNSVMQQESQPLFALQSQQSDLTTTQSAYTTLAAKLGAVETAATGLSTPDVGAQYTATVSDPSSLAATMGTGAVAGRYEVVVNDLARAQVTTANTTAADTDTTAVATGGTLTIGGVAVTVTGPVTLKGLADQINGTTGIGVNASIVESAPGAFRLVLTGQNTGASHAFTITNTLTGGSGVGFTDTDGNGISGDTAADNATQATNASVTVNGVAIQSASNTLTSGIPGTTLSLQQKDPTKTIVVTVANDNTATVNNVKSFISAYNAFITFAQNQATAAGQGQTGTLGHDALLRQLRDALRTGLGAAYGSGSLKHLAEAGVGFDRNGGLTLDESVLNDALSKNPSDVTALFTGSGGTTGAFGALQSLVHSYTQAGGFLGSAEDRLTAQSSRLTDSISDMQDRLAVRRAALQKEYIAADQAMSDLKAQSGNLASFGNLLSSQ